jgi:hypothetical protein
VGEGQARVIETAAKQFGAEARRRTTSAIQRPVGSHWRSGEPQARVVELAPSRWFRETVEDEGLQAAIAEVENDDGLPRRPIA